MNSKKFWIKSLCIALFWLLYVTVKDINEYVTYFAMSLFGLTFIHMGILHIVDLAFDRKPKKSQGEDSEELKLVLVWSDDNRSCTAITMKDISKRLSKEHGIETTHAYLDKLEFCTDKVRIKFVTKVDEYRGVRYDKAFGFNNRPYAKPLIEYVLEQHDI